MLLNLSGYLPGGEDQNLKDCADDLAAEFNAQIADHGEADVLVPAVVMLRVASVVRPAHQDQPGTVNVRIAGLEVVHGDVARSVTETWREQRDIRNGRQPIPGVDEQVSFDLPGSPTGDPGEAARARHNVVDFRSADGH